MLNRSGVSCLLALAWVFTATYADAQQLLHQQASQSQLGISARQAVSSPDMPLVAVAARAAGEPRALPSIKHRDVFTARQAACDGKALRSAESRQILGAIIGGAGAIVGVMAALRTKTEIGQFGPELISDVNTPMLIAGGVGLVYGSTMYFGRASDGKRWDEAVGSLKVGAATSADAVACLGKPNRVSTSTTGDGEVTVLTYVREINHRTRAYSLTFTKAVLSSVDRAVSAKD